MTHTAQELYVYALDTPAVLRNVERTFRTLDGHSPLHREQARKMLLKNNVRDAARLFVQARGLTMQWWRVFPLHEREGCAELFLRMYDNGGRADG